MDGFKYEQRGYCPCCERPTVFSSEDPWFRDHLLCASCSSLVRERALALIISETMPNWRDLAIHESSPGNCYLSAKMKREALGYIGTHYFPDEELGKEVRGFRNENLEAQTFLGGSFDLVLTLDVMEHVFDPAAVYREIYRTLRPGGYYFHTVPIRKWQVDAAIRRAELAADSNVRYLVEPPEYHGNPIDAAGSLVTFDYGYDIVRQIAEWAPFAVRIIRFCDPMHGLIGEYTEVVVCGKPCEQSHPEHHANEASLFRRGA
jgi:SAM-dependent methyltransferase